MKVAIVHDFLNQYGGAERCIEALHEVFPQAPIYTSIYIPNNLPEVFRTMDIRTSFMQKFPFLNRHFKKYLLFYPKAIKSFDLSAYDVILSSSSAFAKGIKKSKNTIHICYCYTPMRFAWDTKSYIEKEKFSIFEKMAIALSVNILKKWDLRSNRSVDYFAAISKAVEARIKRIYGRGSNIIYPPVNTTAFSISDNIKDYFLVTSRLNAYKRIDLVIEAFNKLNLPLRIIGDGPSMARLQKMAHKNVEFLGKVTEKVLIKNYSECQAVIFPGEEDFGIVPLEAQASGRPVIAYAAGGALETIEDGVTGIYFTEQTADSLIEAVKKYQNIKGKFNSQTIRKNALKYDKNIFKRRINDYVMEKVSIAGV